MRVLDLFSGIGGFSLGLERAGMETVAFCEISPKCRHLLATHWPDVPCFDDVTALTGEQIGPVDVICGGFPCQDISFAGKGAGLAGERSGLWRHYARLIGELRPAYVIVENVAALLGRGLGDVLGDLAALGYDAWWDCIPAAAVGAPHRRDRLWLVAYPGSFQHQGFGDALRWAVASELSRALADASMWRGESEQPNGDHQRQGPSERQERSGVRASGRGSGRHRAEGVAVDRGTASRLADPLPHANDQGRERSQERDLRRGSAGTAGDWWSAEPDVGRMAHGVPARVDRLHGLGNAVVPQILEIIGRAIMAAAHHQKAAA